MIRHTVTTPPAEGLLFTASPIPEEAATLVGETLVVIPSKVVSGSYREKALGRLLEHLEWSGFPRDQVEIVNPDGDDFCKGKLITEGANRQDKKYLFQIDGDVLPDLGGFYRWLLDTGNQDKPCMPHRGIYRMDKEETSWVLYSISEPRCRINTRSPKILSALCAGGFWIPKDLYLENPVSEEFVGWGAEDVEFGRRIEEIQQWERFDKFSLHHWHEFDRKMFKSNLEKSPHTSSNSRNVCDRIARQKVVIMGGGGRTGSVLLERALDQHPDIEGILDEPFSKGYKDATHVHMPDAKDKVKWLLDQAESEANVVAFKLLDFHPVQQFARGFLLEELKKQGFVFLHLRRRSLFEQLASHYLAQTEKKYVSLPYESEDVEMDLSWAERVIDKHVNSDAGTKVFLKRVPPHQKLEVFYEDLRDNFDGTIRDIQEWIGVIPIDLKPTTERQMTRPPEEIITNSKEVNLLIQRKTGQTAPPPHYYSSVPGWCDYESFIDKAIENAEDGETIVEIGGFKGMSTAYAGIEILRKNPTIRYHVVDHFKGSTEHQGSGPAGLGKEFQRNSEHLYLEWLQNIKPVDEVVRGIRMDSKKAHEIYPDKSLAAVFIDGEHSFEDCLADIKNWLPKVRPGGYIGGHDYNWKGVKKAVTKAFSNNVTIAKRSWSFKLPN